MGAPFVFVDRDSGPHGPGYAGAHERFRRNPDAAARAAGAGTTPPRSRAADADTGARTAAAGPQPAADLTCGPSRRHRPKPSTTQPSQPSTGRCWARRQSPRAGATRGRPAGRAVPGGRRPPGDRRAWVVPSCAVAKLIADERAETWIREPFVDED